MKGTKIVIGVLRSYGDHDSLSTFTEPRSHPEDITNIGVRFLLKLYGAVRSTSLNKLSYILYTRSVSRSSLSSGFKLESLPPTATAVKFRSYTVPILQCNNSRPCQDNDDDMGLGYIDNTQSVNCDCGEPQTKTHLLCCRLLDDTCSPEDLTIVTERATAYARR